MEKILCAAIHYDDGENYIHQPKNIQSGFVVCGRRHHNCIMTKSILSGQQDTESGLKSYTQGFITNTDRFVDRKEGAEIAYYAKQINEPVLTLYSEDLY